VLWDLRPLGLTGSKVEKVCDLMGITINSQFTSGWWHEKLMRYPRLQKMRWSGMRRRKLPAGSGWARQR
jgi:hypothetical protein